MGVLVVPRGGSGGPGGPGFDDFLGSGRFLALKFGFYKKFHRQNWLEIVGKQKYSQVSGFDCLQKLRAYFEEKPAP